MKKTIIVSFISGIFVSLGFFLVNGGWDTSKITVSDSDLYISGSESLTAEKWNALVNQTFQNKVVNFVCGRTVNSNPGGWVTYTWTSADCGGNPIPSTYNRCFIGQKGVDGTGVKRGLVRCRTSSGQLRIDTAGGSQGVIHCSYLCRNN